MTRISLIAAVARNGVIGRDGGMPWHLPEELRHFKATTMGHTLVMGRRTFESIGRPLPGRETIVVTRNPGQSFEGCHTATSIDAALDLAVSLGRPVFVAGGGEIYRQTLDRADVIHLTTIHTTVAGDVFFPVVPDTFHLVDETAYSTNLDYTYRRYERASSQKT